MSAKLISLRPCQCGKPGVPREIEYEGEVVRLHACDECFDNSDRFLLRVRPIFTAMIAVGVPRDIANEAMTFLLDKLPNDDMLETGPLDILRKVNENGEVGYAEPMPDSNAHAKSDWAAVQECIDKGWLRYGYDASPDIFSRDHGQKRTVYVITALGREALQ